MATDRWSELCDRWSSEGYDSLSKPEKLWLNIRALIDAIENGGAISYFYNPEADTWDDCLDNLRTLKAHAVRVEVEKVAALFPGGVPKEITARNEIINSWPEGEIDSLLVEADEKLMPLMSSLEKQLSRYLKRNGLAT